MLTVAVFCHHIWRYVVTRSGDFVPAPRERITKPAIFRITCSWRCRIQEQENKKKNRSQDQAHATNLGTGLLENIFFHGGNLIDELGIMAPAIKRHCRRIPTNLARYLDI